MADSDANHRTLPGEDENQGAFAQGILIVVGISVLFWLLCGGAYVLLQVLAR